MNMGFGNMNFKLLISVFPLEVIVTICQMYLLQYLITYMKA